MQRILIVDDEEAVRRNFRALLEDAGYVVAEGSTGMEGIAEYVRERPDLILTDLRMTSNKDGLQLVSFIHERDDALPVIVCSGSGTLQDAIDAIRLGAWDYLVKPVQLSEELLVAIQRNLERARLLRENRQYREKLEEMVTERTASLFASQKENQALQAQLMQAQKLESLGRLAGGIAHDFNNLMTVVRGGFDEVRQALPSDGGHDETFDMIEGALNQAADLTRQIFVFAGRAPANPTPCDLNALVAGIEKLLRPAIKGAVSLHTRLAPVPSIKADPVQLQQIIINLVLNAAESMGGRGAVTVRVEERELGPESSEFAYLTGPIRRGDYVALLVEDSGSGMDAATLRRIGDPFFTTKETGHGLGLPTVIGIVRGLGGALGVSSVVGRGTRFLAAFPTVPVVEDSLPPPRSILSRC